MTLLETLRQVASQFERLAFVPEAKAIRDAADEITRLSATIPRRSVAMLLRDDIARHGLRHRKGFLLSDYDGKPPTIEHLLEEVHELADALVAGSLAQQREELGDVFACVLQTASRLGMTFADLDAQAERKLRLRFHGADELDADIGA